MVRKTKPAKSYIIKKKVKRGGKFHTRKVKYVTPKGSLPLRVRPKSERR
jgi:hypothetical protein